ncbi:hypothetical protein D3C81_1760330 [compost metagenome]
MRRKTQEVAIRVNGFAALVGQVGLGDHVDGFVTQAVEDVLDDSARDDMERLNRVLCGHGDYAESARAISGKRGCKAFAPIRWVTQSSE